MELLWFFVLLILNYGAISQTQTTVTFKPSPNIGQDANIFTNNGCILRHNSISSADINYPSSPEFSISKWSYTSDGCPVGTIRSLLKFDELSTIPSNAEIISAELKLFGIPSSQGNNYGNSSYPGSPSGFLSNKSFIQRVTSAWNEQTVTWNTQPTTTTTNQITIPQSTSEWNWNFSDNSSNLVAMIQDMVSNPESNHGFMLRLENESNTYRSLYFATSDHSNSKLWPELTVTYNYSSAPDTIIVHDTVIIEQPCPCEANFTYHVNTANMRAYSFSASNHADDHFWSVNGRHASSESSFTYNFLILNTTNNEVCYTRVIDGKKCDKCIKLCLDTENSITKQDAVINMEQKEMTKYKETIEKSTEKEIKAEVLQGEIPERDMVTLEQSNIEIYPNPTTNEWTIKILSETAENIKIQLSDINGKVVYHESKSLVNGINSITIKTDNLISGNYLLQIKGNTIQHSSKLIKE